MIQNNLLQGIITLNNEIKMICNLRLEEAEELTNANIKIRVLKNMYLKVKDKNRKLEIQISELKTLAELEK